MYSRVKVCVLVLCLCCLVLVDLVDSFGANRGVGGGTTQGVSGPGSTSPNITNPIYPHSATPSAPPLNSTESADSRQAKVLYDYDAADASELSLKADEVGFEGFKLRC